MILPIYASIGLLLVALVTALLAAEIPSTTKSSAGGDARMRWWREARFGMFIHWGIYSVPAGRWRGQAIDSVGEWIMQAAKIPVADYAKLAGQFDPVKFSAEQWVEIANNAGMKYIVITAKHHDGFAMFHSRASRYNIMDATPFGRDPLKELAGACARNDMKLGFYYSQAQDWHQPGGAAKGGHWDRAQDGDMDHYLRAIAVPQVSELLSNYGPVAVLWFDTSIDMNGERAGEFLPLLKSHPQMIVNDRLGGGFDGDFSTPENYIPESANAGHDFEVCMTMNDTWGFKSNDHQWKSARELVHNLVDIASKGGNYLLNVGPTALGEIPSESVDRLAEIGRWMKNNGQSIYGTSASPFVGNSFDGRCTVKGRQLFVHVFSWPDAGLSIRGLKTPVVAASFLADGRPAQTHATSDSSGIPVLSIKPPAHPDPIDTVLALELASSAEVDPRAQVN